MIITFSGGGGLSNRLLHTKNMSGAGLPFLTSSSVDPQTTWLNLLINSWWFFVLMSNVSFLELVAMAIGILCACKWLTSFSIPVEKVRESIGNGKRLQYLGKKQQQIIYWFFFFLI